MECLDSIFEGHHYTADVLDKAFRKHRQWGSRDRRFIAESTYEMVRWWRLLEEASKASFPEKKKAERVLLAYLIKSELPVPAGMVPDPTSMSELKARLDHPAWPRKIKESIPDWLDEQGEKELGTSLWAQELHSLNLPASVYLRANTLKTTPEKLRLQLLQKQVEVLACPSSPDALWLTKRQNLANSDEYQEGLFEIQDIGSQEIAPFLHVAKGMRVIDACAGAGGKTLHLAALMQNQGEIVALDVEPKKLANLQERAKRAGATSIDTFLHDAQTLARYDAFADRLLLDVPCSGSGVLKRHPDTKWKLTLAELEKLKTTQADLLDTYPAMLKPGGELVYATCSIFPSENKQQITDFLKRKEAHFTLLEEKHTWPSEGGDGFYMARLRKNP